MKTTGISQHPRMRLNSLVIVGVFMIVAAVVAVPVYSVRSSSLPPRSTVANERAAASASHFNRMMGSSPTALPPWATTFRSLVPDPPPLTIATYESPGCSTPKASFNLGETVCAIITGATQPDGDGRAQTRIGWVSPYGSLAQGAVITSDPQTDSYVIPVTATQTFTDAGGGTTTIDNRGVWRLRIFSALDGSLISSVDFTVHDPAKAYVDLSLHQSETISEADVSAGSGSVFKLFLTNNGPDDAQSVVLSDTVPANTTFSSMVETTGLGFTCGTPDGGGVFTCTLASMPAGATASFTFAYDVMAGTPEGTLITNTANVSSSDTPCAPDSCEFQPADNVSSSTSKVPASTGAETCTLICHANMSVVANTTQDGNPGAIVTFGAASGNGNCGALTATFSGLPSGQPASGAFYPVGTTVVQVTSETGGGNCSFTVTVVEGTAPTITCPPDKTATDDGSGGHTFTEAEIGSPTTTPSTDVIVTYERSDNIPATYDSNGDELTPAVIHSLTDPFPTGTTGITWTVRDSNGLTASCTQRIMVHAPCATDTAAPTITAPPDVTRFTGPGSTTCGVVLNTELGQPDVQDDCAATFTRTGVPPGDLFPIGVTTITYTATDGAGHTASDTQTVTITDNTPPVIFAPPNASYTCPSEVPVLSASQAFGPDVNGNPDPTKPVFDNCGSPAVTASQTSSGAGSAASPLVIVRTYTALDSHGNIASAMQTITVADPTPPAFTFVPAAVTAYSGPDATTCDTVVNPGTATATDNCGAVTVTRVPAGNTFPVGSTTVTWTATDAAGNQTVATQLVTVIDNTPPKITCDADIIADFNPAVNGAVVTFTAPVGTDNCPGATTAQTAGLASGSTFPLGTTTNTFTVTDAAGNSASCSFKVTVAVTSLIGLDSVSITGLAYTDSYNSTGGYPATKGSLVNVLSNGTITLGNSGKVWGNVRSTQAGVNMSGASQVTGDATAGTTVSRSGSALVGGTITNNAPAPTMTMPAVPACSPFSSNSGISGTYSYNSSTGDLSLSGINVATLANGTYCFHNLTLTNSGELKVNGPVVIKLTGTLSTSGATKLNNTTAIPANLQVLSSYASSTNGVTFGNGTSVYLVLYAPATGVSDSGAAPLFGTIVGKKLTLSNSGAIHYDTNLKNAWPGIWTLIFGP